MTFRCHLAHFWTTFICISSTPYLHIKVLAGCQIHIARPNQLGVSLSICGAKTGLS